MYLAPVIVYLLGAGIIGPFLIYLYHGHSGFLFVWFLLGQLGATASILLSGRLYHARPDKNTNWDWVLHTFIVGTFYFTAVVLPGSIFIWIMNDIWLYIGYSLAHLYYVGFLRVYLGAFVRIAER